MRSRTLVKAAKMPLAIGQIGGHVKSGIEIPRGKRTHQPMALVSAVPLAEDDDRMVLAFLDRSDPVETFDREPESGDNAVIIVPREQIGISIVKGVCPGDWRGVKLDYGDYLDEPVDLDVDPSGLDLEASDAWVDMVDEIGADCTKLGGYPVWQNAPLDIDSIMETEMRFHHRIAGDLVDLGLGDGGVVYVFVDEAGERGCVCWQQAGGGAETTYHHYQ